MSQNLTPTSARLIGLFGIVVVPILGYDKVPTPLTSVTLLMIVGGVAQGLGFVVAVLRDRSTYFIAALCTPLIPVVVRMFTQAMREPYVLEPYIIAWVLPMFGAMLFAPKAMIARFDLVEGRSRSRD